MRYAPPCCAFQRLRSALFLNLDRSERRCRRGARANGVALERLADLSSTIAEWRFRGLGDAWLGPLFSRRPDLPVHVAYLVGLAIAAELAHHALPRAPSHRFDASGVAHQRFERGDKRIDVANWLSTPSSPSVMIISAALARAATTASPAAIASSMVSPNPSTREANT